MCNDCHMYIIFQHFGFTPVPFLYFIFLFYSFFFFCLFVCLWFHICLFFLFNFNFFWPMFFVLSTHTVFSFFVLLEFNWLPYSYRKHVAFYSFSLIKCFFIFSVCRLPLFLYYFFSLYFFDLSFIFFFLLSVNPMPFFSISTFGNKF